MKLHRYLTAIKLMGQVAVDHGVRHPVEKYLLDAVGKAASNGLILRVGELVLQSGLGCSASRRKHLISLENQGLLTININQDDQRSRLVELTDRGNRYFAKMNTAILGRVLPKSGSVGARVWRG
ncbi:MAG: hypothetical protein V4536_08460 [Pseudomonadota bacterium]